MTKKLEKECENLNWSISDLNTKQNEENQQNILRCRQQHESSQCKIYCLENKIKSKPRVETRVEPRVKLRVEPRVQPKVKPRDKPRVKLRVKTRAESQAES